MTDETQPPAAKPKPTITKPTAADQRQDRLAARLRENLRKRKDQARQRDQEPSVFPSPAPGEGGDPR